MELFSTAIMALVEFILIFGTGYFFVKIGLAAIRSSDTKRQLICSAAYIWFTFGIAIGVWATIKSIDYLAIKMTPTLFVLSFLLALGTFYWIFRKDVEAIRRGSK